MPSSMSFTYLDRSGERSTVTIPVTAVTAANFDTVLGNAPTQGRAELTAAIDALTLLNPARVSAKAYDIPDPGAVPPLAVPYAEREFGLRIFMRGASSGKLYTLTIPGPDFANLTHLSGDDYDLADAGILAALVTALEDNYKGYTSPAEDTFEAITVIRAIAVGRNS